MRYTCPKTGCGWMYEAPTNYRYHCYKKHNIRISLADESKIRTCSICGRIKIDENHEKHHDKMIHKCSRCGWMYQNWNTLDSHCRSRHGYGIKRKRKSTCSICGRKNIDPDHKKDHEKMIHKCPESGCGWMYENWGTLQSHGHRKHGISPHVGQEDRTCSVCGRKNVDPDHERNHDKMIHKCPKSGCGWMYENWRTLQSHCSRKHGITLQVERQERTCSVCGRKNIDPYHEKDHDKMVHKCPESECGWMYENWSSLQRHCKTKHGIILQVDEQECTCSICGRKNVDPDHERDHDKMIHKCPESGCGWMFQIRSAFQRHYQRKHGTNQHVYCQSRPCSICGRRNIDQDHEKDHDKMVHKCPESGCGWMYENWGTLQSHCSRKHGISPLMGQEDRTCSICGRKNIDPYHEKDHDKMVHRCPESGCGWMYKNWETLRVHCRRKHGITLQVERQDRTCSICGRMNVEQDHDKMIHKCPGPGCGWTYENCGTLSACVQSTENSGLLGLDAIKREAITNNTVEKCPSESQIIIGEAECNYGTDNVERICVKTEPPEESNGENSEQMGGQNEIESCVNTNKRNGDRKARNFQSGENVCLVDSEGSKDDSNDSKCDPKDDKWESLIEDWSYRKTGIIECHLCGRRLIRRTYKYHIENHEKMRFKCMCG